MKQFYIRLYKILCTYIFHICEIFFITVSLSVMAFCWKFLNDTPALASLPDLLPNLTNFLSPPLGKDDIFFPQSSGTLWVCVSVVVLLVLYWIASMPLNITKVSHLLFDNNLSLY